MSSGMDVARGEHHGPLAYALLQRIVVDSAKGTPEKALHLWSDAPRFEISTAPLADKDGQAVQLPDSFHGDHALFLSDQQVYCPLHLPVLQATL